ncbi:MAG: hypothetical protein K2I75_08235 [Clostridiales bacterium]|nr:hypothetical protein [Clostridiales bacterium]
MKEILAKRDKSFFLIIVAVGLASLAIWIPGLVYFPRLQLIYIFGISFMGFVTLIGTIGLCLPKWVIIKEGNNIIIHNGFRGFKKKTLQISDIVGAKVQEFPQQSKAKPNGNIVLTVKSENSSTKDIIVIQIKNTAEVVQKLNLLIQQ